MREFPITTSSHVYHIDSSGSKSFDSDPFYRKSAANASDNNFHPVRQTTSTHCANKTANVNYVCASNDDLTSMHGGSGGGGGHGVGHGAPSNRSANNVTISSETYCNRKSSIGTAIEGNGCKRNGDKSRSSASYTILDAITNAVAAGNCANSVYPLPDTNNMNDFDRNNFDTDELSERQTTTTAAGAAATTTNTTSMYGNQKNGLHHEPDAPFQQYNYGIENSRSHQYPSLNYKHSYLLWIGTPVAAR